MANIDAGLVRGPQGPLGPKGEKGDPFTYADFTESQIAELQRPATEAATRADKATKDAQAAIAEVKATEAKLYPAAENTLKGKAKDVFVHVDDAFPSTLLGIEIEGATRQVTTTGKNLVDAYNQNNERGYLAVDGSLKTDDKYHVSDYVSIEPSTTYFITMSSKTHTSAPSVCEYDSGKAFVAGHNNLGRGAAFTTASNAAFVRVSCKTDEPDVIQLEKGSIQTAYEPYSGGKPSPSPEYPQEIKVIENPVVKVTGRNLFDGELDNATGNSVNPIYLSKGTYTISLFSNADWWSTSENKKSVYIHDYYRNIYLTSVNFIDVAVGKRSAVTFNLKEDAVVKIYSYGSWKNENVSDVQIERGSVATEYKPYTSQSLAFTLPTEHPYLAKLPDGTTDKIIIDKDGNVKLVANVKKIVWDGTASYIRSEESGMTYKRFIHRSKGIVKGGNGIGLLDRLTVGNSYSYDMQANVSAMNTGELYSNYQAAENSIDKYVEWLKGDVTGYMPTLAPKEYDLGRIDILVIPESVSNIWVDAEVTPNVDIEYTRDVNIVVANLESAIASITKS